MLSKELSKGLKQKDARRVRDAAIAVVEWGGVKRGNAEYLRGLRNSELLEKLRTTAKRLDPDTADLSDLANIDRMNAGFSKIYSLIIPNHRSPMYDSRVACALTSLVRLYCEQTEGCEEVPECLAFGILPHRSRSGSEKTDRAPSSDKFTFKDVHSNLRYAQSNVMAAWILGELAQNKPFKKEPHPTHALQSAMFMIGYQELPILSR